MKYKFYETEFSASGDNRMWPEEVFNNTFVLFRKEVQWLSDNTGKEYNKFKVDDMTFGEPVVFYDGHYIGYLDSLFYYAMDVDCFEDWWGFEN
jgi:hypothetical protein